MNRSLMVAVVGFVFLSGACSGPDVIVHLPGGAAVGLSRPIKIENLAYYKDGGTTSFALVGKNGKSLRYSALAGLHIRMNGPSARTGISRSCVGADFPDRPGAIVLARGSDDEKSILAALHIWADSQASRERQANLRNGGAVLGLVNDEVRLYRVLDVIRGLEIP